MTHCRVTVSGPVAASVLAELRSRFDLSSVTCRGDATVLVVRHVDQAAQRALLTVLWDTGHAIDELTSDHHPW